MDQETKFLLTLPSKLKKEFQLICIQNDTNMSDTLRQLMREYIQKNKKP